MKAYVQSTLFLIVTLGTLSYVAMELDEFNEKMSRELTHSYTEVMPQYRTARK